MMNKNEEAHLSHLVEFLALAVRALLFFVAVTCAARALNHPGDVQREPFEGIGLKRP